MAKSTITAEERAELQRLQTELLEAYEHAAAALRTGGAPLEGSALARALEADAKAGAIVRRIKEILGTADQPWNAQTASFRADSVPTCVLLNRDSG